MRDMLPLLDAITFPPLARGALETVQVNLGYRCNQSCVHCHVAASPRRTEMMDADTVSAVIALLRHCRPAALDLTGGAPELNPHFRALVRAARALGLRVIDRCNLTVLDEPDQSDLAPFLAAQAVEITASLPCYREDNVDAQRGAGTFARSLAGLRRLNALGYGRDGSGLVLNLVYNPQGPALAPPQAGLEADYRRELGERHGIVFTHLFTLTNMPIQRFGTTLVSEGAFAGYIDLLRAHHSDANLAATMCRSLISVDYRGYVHDCDFNQMLGLPLGGAQEPVHVSDLMARNLAGAPIRVAGHCYACTAGQGSSCGGALAQAAE